MKTLIIICMAVVLGVVPEVVFGEAAMPDMDSQDKSVAKKPAEVSGERKILYWKAPMDPNFRSKIPGKSPMGMDLVPVYEDEVKSGGQAIDGRQPLTINPRMRQLLGVRTVAVEEDLLERTIRTVAIVKPDEERVYHMHSRVSGWLDKVYKRAVGDRVRKGELLFDFYSPDLVTTQQELLDARRQKNSAGENLARDRLRLFDVSQREIKRILEAGKPQTTLHFYAPHSGIIVMAMATDGLAIKPNDHLYDIVDLSQVWVIAHLYESEISLIKKGQPARVDTESGDVLWGKVDYVYPIVEDKTRTVKVRFVFANQDNQLRPDAYANTTISVELDEGLVIPKTALLFTGGRSIAFVDMGQGVFEPRELRLGAEGDRGFLVKAGVIEGEKVVDSANFLIDSESSLRDALLNFSQ